MTPMLGMMMNMLKSRNPKGYNELSTMINSGGDPRPILKQMMGNSNPQQIQQVFTQARNMGVPDSFLSQIQNMR